MKLRAPSFSYVIIFIITYTIVSVTSAPYPVDYEAQIQELKIKAITSVELSSMSFDEIPSLFFLYENLVTKRFKSISKEDNPKKFEEFRKIHQHHAIKNSFYSLKLTDIFLYEDFNAEDLEIMSNKVNWTVNEVTSYGFLGKQKENSQNQGSNKEFIFHEPAMADFFISQYFLDNIVHPKDHPSDDEIELRLRFFFFITANLFNRNYLANEFIVAMIEDQNGEMFNNQVRSSIKYKFSNLLDPLLVDGPEHIEKMSTIFGKDNEILRIIWRVDDSQPFVLRFFGRRRVIPYVEELKDVAEKFFTTEANSTSKLLAENLFRGKNQILNVLYMIYEKKDQNFTRDILKVTKYEVSDEILTKLSEFENFLDFVDSSSYSLAEKQEFFISNAYNMIGSTWTAEKLLQLWHRIEKYFTKVELKLILTQKDSQFNHTHLFHIPGSLNYVYAEALINLTKTFLNPAEIKEFLSQRRPICQESFLTHYLKVVENATTYELSYNFAKEFSTHEELKSLMFNNKDKSFIQKIAEKQKIFKIGTKILSEFYTKAEIQDMLITTDERKENLIFWVIEALRNESRQDVADYLREIFKGRDDKLKQILRTKDNHGDNIFTRFDGSYYEEKIQPFLDLAKEIFSDQELKKILKNN